MATAATMVPRFLKAMEGPNKIPAAQKILVVLQLSGGNDGLNTIIPFRNDLYYRINVFPIHVPPLRVRGEDISIIASYFLDTFSRSFGRNFKSLSPDAEILMREYHWPGNIRELRNVIERICIMHYGPILLPEHLPQEIRCIHGGILPAHQAAQSAILTEDTGLEDAVMNFEINIIKQALEKTRGNVLQTAAILKIPRGTLRYKMDKYELEKGR